MHVKFSKVSPRICPYSDCESHLKGPNRSPKTGRSVRNPDSVLRSFQRQGRYFRKDDGRWIPRYRCRCCQRTFSTSRWTPPFGQKKRTINSQVLELLCSGVSQRRVARLLRINPKTAVRKFLFLSSLAQAERRRLLLFWAESPEKLEAIQFDEMESFERSKCLPLSIPLAVDPKSRKILGFRVASMPAKGPLAEISRKKYGPRADERAARAEELLREIQPLIAAQAKITTDQNPRYPDWLKASFPKARHRTVKGKRGCVVGQGELKKVVFDPLFALNHTAAMIRANVNRLFRRTWCTTKRPDRLAAHLELYVQYHNQLLVG